MAKKEHKYSSSKRFVAGTVGALSVFTLTTQANNVVEAKAKQSKSTTEQQSSMSSSASALHSDSQLSLAPVTSSSSSATKENDGTYIVKRGDTLSELAEHFNVTVDNLVAWNNIQNPNLIYVGQRLSINGKNISSAVSQSNASSATTQQNNVSNTGVVSQPQSFVVQGTQTQPQVQAAVNSAARPQPQVQQAELQQPAQPSAQSSENNTQITSSVSQSQAGQGATATTADANAAAYNGTAVSQATQPVVTSDTASQYAPSVASSVSQPVSANSVTPSQTPASQVPASQSQQVVNTAYNSQGQQTSAQSQTTTTQPQQAATSQASTDLQSGSVVSLASKIATSNSVPYVWGGNSLSGMDCSGFVDYVYANAEGKQLPHNTVALESYVNEKPVSQAQAGDLLFWGNPGASYHVGIYMGNNQYAAAAKPGTNVAIYNLSNYFYPSFAGTVK